ncbi:C40 family peptidase [Kineosporia sp. J2-2]|uniref:C40 family peptidase n=1 Tax=Kineosporia corallincola TaxID=2835133 RepID=A0ABS5TTR6_9ACTN|nr:NlpC/P60 family protein [Kineosporia corallincola]MBT0774173.1 C40 family peptidase [Kineosporia corallincola]
MDDERVGYLLLGSIVMIVLGVVAVSVLMRAALDAAAFPARLPYEAAQGLLETCTGGPDDEPDSTEMTRLLEAFDEQQRQYAAVIVRTGQDLKVPMRGWVIAVATAVQESGLRNLAHGDQAGPDSRGLFQQRAAWGPATARSDPHQATTMFYTGGRAGQPGLLDVTGWQGMSVTHAAQAVQHSARPGAYAEHEKQALALVLDALSDHQGQASIASILTRLCSGLTDAPQRQAGKAVQTAIGFARAQLGQPYLWGGDGPDAGEDGFDCSGLTRAAYAAAGITLPRTAQAQYDHGPGVSLNDLQPGDLVFFGADPSTVTHVGLYLGGHRMIDAPHTGAVVRIEDHRWSTLLGATRPATR